MKHRHEAQRTTVNGIQMCPWHPNTWTQLGVLGKIAQRGYNAFIKGRVNKRRQEKLNLFLASRETGQIHQVKKHGSQGLFTYLPQWANRRKTWTGNGKRTKSNWKVPGCGSEEPQLRSHPFRHKLYIQVLLRFSPMPSRALVSQCHLLILCCYSLAYSLQCGMAQGYSEYVSIIEEKVRWLPWQGTTTRRCQGKTRWSK